MKVDRADKGSNRIKGARRPKWRGFERKSCKIVLKIAFPNKILLDVQPGAARIAPSSIEKSLYYFLSM
jgi:hypothetical protein